MQEGYYTSYRSILKITLPLVVVHLSSYLMMSIDRIILSTVDINMMNSVAMSMSIINIFIHFFTFIIEKNSIFTSQYYGDKQYTKVSTCVWQMIFFSFLLIPLALAVSFFSDKLHILPDYLCVYGIPYQKIIFSFSFTFFLYEALTTFFVGQGKTYILSISIILGCIVNVILSIFFIKVFNLGTIGSAYGTILGLLAEILFLGYLFLNKSNNEIFKTRTISYDFSLLKKIFKLGLPTGFVNSLTQVSWISIMYLINEISSEQLTIYNLFLTAYLFFSFISYAVSQSVASIGAKLVAVNNLSEIKNLLKKMMVIIFTFLFCVSISIFFFKETIIEGIINIAPNTRSYSDIIELCLYTTILWQPLEFAHRTLQGICISGGDTKFVSTMNASVFIGFNLTSILTLKYMGLLTSIRPIMCIFTIDAIGLFIIFYLRYKSLKWFKKII